MAASPNREFGYARLKVLDVTSRLFQGLPPELDVWMSHGDHVTEVPPGFHVTALTDDALNAMEDQSRGIYGVQFHPEVAHTPLGAQVLRNFCFRFVGVGVIGRRRQLSKNKSNAFAISLAIKDAWSRACQVASTRLWPRRWYTERSEIDRLASLSTMGCCGKVSLNQRSRCCGKA